MRFEWSDGEVRFYLQHPTENRASGWFDVGFYPQEHFAVEHAKKDSVRFNQHIRVVRRTMKPKRSERVIWDSAKPNEMKRE